MLQLNSSNAKHYKTMCLLLNLHKRATEQNRTEQNRTEQTHREEIDDH